MGMASGREMIQASGPGGDMSRGRRTIQVAVAGLLMLMTPLPGEAAHSSFDESVTASSCTGFLSQIVQVFNSIPGTTCTTILAADKDTGALTADVTVQSLFDVGGTGTGSAGLVTSRTIKSATREISYTVAFHVSRIEREVASAVHDADEMLCGGRCLGGAGTGPRTVTLFVTALHTGCAECFVRATCEGCSVPPPQPARTVFRRVAPADDPDVDPVGDYIVTFTLVHPFDEDVPPGTVRITSGVVASASHGFDPLGRARAAVDATVTSVGQG